jgi:hypothetical protein
MAIDRSSSPARPRKAMFTQTFHQVMLPPGSHVLGTPNRDGQVAY